MKTGVKIVTFGCLIPLGVMITAVIVLIGVICYQESWIAISESEARIATTEQMREISGIQNLPEIYFASATAYRPNKAYEQHIRLA